MNARRRSLGLVVSGFDAPRPIATFGQTGFDTLLLTAIVRAGYKEPTPIQAQALPAILSGRWAHVCADVMRGCFLTCGAFLCQFTQGSIRGLLPDFHIPG